MDIGIAESDRQRIVNGLNRVLADTYTLYLMTHNFHWNVEGPMFNTLHLMFETQYTELWASIDLIAERIRSLGAPAPGTYKQFAALTSVKEPDGVPEALDMVRQGHVKLETIALRLGFAEYSTFHRAFRRWTGTGPTEYRANPPAS